jgi:hypothetical protein
VKKLLTFACVLGAIVVLAVLWTANCSGPQPKVIEASFRAPENPDHPYSVSAIVSNDSRGRGQVSVTFRLKDKASGLEYEKEASAELKPHDQVVVETDIDAPEGDYTLDVDVEYPPD